MAGEERLFIVKVDGDRVDQAVKGIQSLATTLDISARNREDLSYPVITSAELQDYANILDADIRRGRINLTVQSALEMRKIASRLHGSQKFRSLVPFHNYIGVEPITGEDWDQFCSRIKWPEAKSIAGAFDRFLGGSGLPHNTTMNVVRRYFSQCNSAWREGVGKSTAAFIHLIMKQVEDSP